MPARTGKAKADAGRFQKKPNKKAAVRKRKDRERPSIPEVEPLYSTYAAPKPEGAYYDEDAANHAVEWIESLVHFKGRWAGTPFYLMAWQARIVREIFGWMREDATRLYRNVYVEAPRKSGKTSLAAAVALHFENENGEQFPNGTIRFLKCRGGRQGGKVEISREHSPFVFEDSRLTELRKRQSADIRLAG